MSFIVNINAVGPSSCIYGATLTNLRPQSKRSQKKQRPKGRCFKTNINETNP